MSNKRAIKQSPSDFLTMNQLNNWLKTNLMQFAQQIDKLEERIKVLEEGVDNSTE